MQGSQGQQRSGRGELVFQLLVEQFQQGREQFSFD